MPEYTLHDYDEDEAKHPASAGCHPTTCSALRDTLADLYDAQQNLGKERGKVTRLMMAIDGVISELEYIMDSAVSVPIYAACSTRIEELRALISDIKQNKEL